MPPLVKFSAQDADNKEEERPNEMSFDLMPLARSLREMPAMISGIVSRAFAPAFAPALSSEYFSDRVSLSPEAYRSVMFSKKSGKDGDPSNGGTPIVSRQQASHIAHEFILSEVTRLLGAAQNKRFTLSKKDAEKLIKLGIEYRSIAPADPRRMQIEAEAAILLNKRHLNKDQLLMVIDYILDL